MRAAGMVRAFLQAVRERPGWFTAATGAALCVLGWYGISGERVVERQLPYLASATIPGAALIVAGATLSAVRRPGRGDAGEQTDRRIEQLYTLLVEPEPEPAEPAPARHPADAAASGEQPGDAKPGETRLAVPDGTLYHRPGCPLVAGKEQAEPVDVDRLRRRGLTPCPLCEPGPPQPPQVQSQQPPQAQPPPPPDPGPAHSPAPPDADAG
ncbi:hypothetical protein [Kitasatospora sp. NPDC050543]|uniref:hypothetical protein n=1 Tax=Kitasatospora sp. NPDC050543 TaxID=3364054 RepID=UPI003789895D